MIPRSKGLKSDASLLAGRFLNLGAAKNNPVSKGSKYFLTPTLLICNTTKNRAGSSNEPPGFLFAFYLSKSASKTPSGVFIVRIPRLKLSSETVI